MTRRTTLAWTIASVLVLGAVTADAEPTRHRQAHQRARIHQGHESGDLTPRETRALVREQHRIGEARERALADGEVSRAEARRLHGMRERSSRHIYRLRHNDHEVETE